MRGQETVKQQIIELAENNSYPRFSIIAGKKGAGKKTLGKFISNTLGHKYIIWTNKIDDIRELVTIMNKQTDPIVYCIPEYEDMSQGARNALLKICEEPPNNSYIILTSSIKEIILPTLLGRGTVFELNSYSKEELFTIAKESNNSMQDSEISAKIKYCEVPGEFEVFGESSIEEFEKFINILWQNIGVASAGNLLKITSKIQLKEEGQGYNINLFMNGLSLLNSSTEDLRMRSKIYSEIINAKREIQLKYNKQYVIDNLLLNIRGIRNGII